MSKLAIVITIAIALVIILFVARRRATSNEPPVMMELRSQLLRSTPDDLGIALSPGQPYVAVMDFVHSTAVVSVVTASTGDASIYFSSGGGIIGGIGHEAVRRAAIAFVTEAGKHLGNFVPTNDDPHPSAGNVCFYIRSTEGLFTAQASEAALAEGKHALSPLYVSGQEVITQLRVVSEAQ